MKRILTRIADWLIERAQRTPYVHITDEHGSTYMERFWLIPYNRLGIAARVHHILRSDEDRHMHDHPWWSVSVILRGGYWEVLRKTSDNGAFSWDEPVWRGPGSVIFRRARDWHRLELPSSVPTLHYSSYKAYIQNIERDTEEAEKRRVYEDCWTLFITGPKRKDGDPDHSCWGFLVDGVKVPADVYLGERYIATDYDGQGHA